MDRPRLLGILNLTPDSFHAASRACEPGPAIDRALAMLRAGADGLDLGAESTRPGSSPVDAATQLERLLPILRGLRDRAPAGAIITIDTTQSAVARAALDAGADAINDVSAGLDDPAMLRLIAERGCGVILMHRLAPPSRDAYSDQYGRKDQPPPPRYQDVVMEVAEFLARRALAAIEMGIDPASIVLDPGLGFGKTVEQNLELIARTGVLTELGYPVLSGLSRKSFVGRFMGLPEGGTPAERLPGTLELSRRHMTAGARLLRVHDVPEHAALISDA